MGLKVGIVGLPNVGKSTLFNTLTNLRVDASNYPFCTIEPNKGVVSVSDKRLDQMSKIVNSSKVIYSCVEFIDIAGLVRGASKGEGLGNQFLSHIREVDAIVHVVRTFGDKNVTHVDGFLDPLRDIDTVNTELILKDLETVAKRISSMKKEAKFNEKSAFLLECLELLQEHLSSGKLAINFELEKNSLDFVNLQREMHLLTNKPFMYLVNTDNLALETEIFRDMGLQKGAQVEFLDIKTAYELSTVSADERDEYITELGIESISINDFIEKCFRLLGLISFFTVGKDEARAWTIKMGTPIDEAAGVIHTDFTKNFIAAEVVSSEDFLMSNGWVDLKAKGKIRLEGRGYILKDGEVIIVKHNS
jgi:ribosome-binding ATPase